MKKPIIKETNSITTKGPQKLVMNLSDAKKIEGKDVGIVDDVISTGSTLNSLEGIVKDAGAEIKVKAAILEEGENRKDVYTLGRLPLFEEK